MDAESYGKDAVKTVYYNHAYSGSKLLKLKVTPPSLLPSSSAALALCLSSPPFLILRDLSLLFEAAGRTVNPVNGAVGLLSTGNWHICQAAVETVLRGGALRPLTDLESSSSECTDVFKLRNSSSTSRPRVEKRRRPYEPEMKQPDQAEALPPKMMSEKRRSVTPSRTSEESVTTSCYESGSGSREVKLLNLF